MLYLKILCVFETECWRLLILYKNSWQVLYGRCKKLHVTTSKMLFYFFKSLRMNKSWKLKCRICQGCERKDISRNKQYWAMSVICLAQGNNGLPLTWLEPMWPAILRFLVRCVYHSTTPPLFKSFLTKYWNKLNIHFVYKLEISFFAFLLLSKFLQVN